MGRMNPRTRSSSVTSSAYAWAVSASHRIPTLMSCYDGDLPRFLIGLEWGSFPPPVCQHDTALAVIIENAL